VLQPERERSAALREILRGQAVANALDLAYERVTAEVTLAAC